MDKKQYDFAVFIGRFQPFHNGHKAVVDKALSISKRVIILVGSANLPRSTRNPFTFSERADMIDSVYPKEVLNERLIIAPINDFTYDNDGWIASVQDIVSTIVRGLSPRQWSDKSVWDASHLGENKVTLIGRNKDNSSFYLKLFPNWSSEDAFDDSVAFLNATDIRNRMFDKNPLPFINDTSAPISVLNKLSKFKASDHYKQILEEQEFCNNYKKQFESLPYAPTFNTVDAVIKCSGHILLVTRKANPGKGLLALPGGFIKPDETLFDACLRELKEETRIRLTDETLKLAFKQDKTYDDPYRDPRGRFITQAFLFDLGNRTELPWVKGGDDAKKADWVPIASLTSQQLYADHYFIIRNII